MSFGIMTTFARKNTSKIEVARTSLIFTYYLNHSLFGYAKKCMSQLSFQKTNWVVNVAIEFSRLINGT